VKEGVTETVGVADLDKERLEELYEWAEVKPKVNQVNLAHCCTIPEVGGWGTVARGTLLTDAVVSMSSYYTIRITINFFFLLFYNHNFVLLG